MPVRAPSTESDTSQSESLTESSRSRTPIPKQEDILVIRVHNLTRNVTLEHVREIFGKFGTIKEVEAYVKDPICDFPKGRSTIEFSNNDEAIEAFAQMKGAQIDGDEVNVSLIKITGRERKRPRSPDAEKKPASSAPLRPFPAPARRATTARPAPPQPDESSSSESISGSDASA
eukprot:TRINITY_DN12638_c0_g1_i1.p1 TRINITY_DN12638_c0_g1~~TRINITY_DN12638_c0_g1_i1.p1  ORF type:complete len:174 (+),score=19.49 TRINITY_DN12638_c0_g1_i1:60-581(+)